MKFLGAILALVLALPAAADQQFGPVTQLPMPRYVSIKATEANARRGPSTTHRIDWVFQRRHLPVQITAEYGHWRRIRDQEGASGWVHYALLSGSRFVTITEDQAAFRRGPSDDAEVVARAEMGVIARLGKCTPAWCFLRKDGHKGWVAKAEIWGVAPGEVRD